MTTVVCLASPKGGSGKTMLTATFANFAAAMGQRVLMVDTDAATNGLTLLHLSEVVAYQDHHFDSQVFGLFDTDDGPHAATFVPIANGVDLCPATFGSVNPENTSLFDFLHNLKDVLQRARTDYDLVLLDAQAGADLFAQEAVRPGISDRVVIVSEYDPMSAAGVERMKLLMPEGLQFSRTWVLLNKILPEFARSFSEFLEVARYAPPIPWNADVVRAYARRSIALDLENGNEYTVAVMRTLRAVLREELSDALDSWANERPSLLRNPVEVTLAKLKREYEMTDEVRKRLVLTIERRQVLMSLIAIMAAIIGGLLGTAGAFLPIYDSVRYGLLIAIGGAAAACIVDLRVPKDRLEREEREVSERRATLRAQLDSFEGLSVLGVPDAEPHRR